MADGPAVEPTGTMSVSATFHIPKLADLDATDRHIELELK